MEAKQKAQELFDKFLPFAETEYGHGIKVMKDIHVVNARQCALICVGEILHENQSADDRDYSEPNDMEFWLEVREELLKF